MAPKSAERLQLLRANGYTVKVSHLRISPLATAHAAIGYPMALAATERHIRSLGLEPLPKGGMTIVSIYGRAGSKVAVTGHAICRPDESFNRRLGLAIALGRAEKVLVEKERLEQAADIPF